jgi:hypothetical protein
MSNSGLITDDILQITWKEKARGEGRKPQRLLEGSAIDSDLGLPKYEGTTQQ